MLKALFARLHQGYQTIPYPKTVPTLPDRLRGIPEVKNELCGAGCSACAEVCPTRAIEKNGAISIDLGACIFCTECSRACPTGAIRFTGDHRLSARNRGDLVIKDAALPECRALPERTRKLFGRSLKLRQVSAGGCNACEADINVLSTVGWDLGRFGIQIVASPRHADGLIITGPVTENMKLALEKTYAAVPSPKIVIAVGACAVSGGIFRGSPTRQAGAASTVPVDLYIPGCPPHPLTILDGLLRLLGKL